MDVMKNSDIIFRKFSSFYVISYQRPNRICQGFSSVWAYYTGQLT